MTGQTTAELPVPISTTPSPWGPPLPQTMLGPEKLGTMHNASSGTNFLFDGDVNSGPDANIGLFSCVPQLGVSDEFIHASVYDSFRAI